SMTCASGRAQATASHGANRSATMTSASSIAARPVTVTKPGSPGPAPTSVTWPTPAVLFSAAGAGSGRRSAAARTTTSYDDSSGGVDVQVSRPRFARSSTAAHTTGAAIVTSAPS